MSDRPRHDETRVVVMRGDALWHTYRGHILVGMHDTHAEAITAADKLARKEAEPS